MTKYFPTTMCEHMINVLHGICPTFKAYLSVLVTIPAIDGSTLSLNINPTRTPTAIVLKNANKPLGNIVVPALTVLHFGRLLTVNYLSDFHCKTQFWIKTLSGKSCIRHYMNI